MPKTRDIIKQIKEIKEETSLNTEYIKPMYVNTDYYEDKNLYFIFIGYEERSNGYDVSLSEEHIDFFWTTKEESLELDSTDFIGKIIDEVL